MTPPHDTVRQLVSLLPMELRDHLQSVGLIAVARALVSQGFSCSLMHAQLGNYMGSCGAAYLKMGNWIIDGAGNEGLYAIASAAFDRFGRSPPGNLHKPAANEVDLYDTNMLTPSSRSELAAMIASLDAHYLLSGTARPLAAPHRKRL